MAAFLTQNATMRMLLIVHHTLTGGTLQMVQAAQQGAAGEPDVQVRLLSAQETGVGDLLAATGYLFATPENLASMSGMMKDFFDRTYYGALGRIEGRPYAGMVCAGSDGEGAARQMARIATGWRLRPVAEPLIVCTHAQTPEAIAAPKHIVEADRERCRAFGKALAAGLALGIF